MKKIIGLLVVGILFITFLGGCGGGSGTAPAGQTAGAGTLTFSLDLSNLASNQQVQTAQSVDAVTTAATVAAGSVTLISGPAIDRPTVDAPLIGGKIILPAPADITLTNPTVVTQITSVTVNLTRENFAPTSTELAVSNNIATGRIDNLDAGYWHVTVHVFSGEQEIYTGETDSKVIAGVEVQTKVLFDPVQVNPTTGSLAFTVGLNPMPGYKTVDQQVSKILYSEVTGKLYILDASAKIIGVYNADTMIREKDIPISAPPLSVALSYAKDELLLGYPSGQIYRLDPATEKMTLVGDILTEVNNMVAVSDKVLLAAGKGSYDCVFKAMDTTTGQVLSSKNYWYSFGDITFNPANNVAYGQSVYVSPSDIHRIQVDPVTGAIAEIKDSPYHGDYYLGMPMRIIKNGTRIAVASGATFSSSSLSSQDLQYNGNIGYAYVDLATDDLLGYLYLVSKTTLNKLLVINQTNFFLEKTVELLGEPKLVYQTPTKIIVFVTKDSANYVKVFDKKALGCTPVNIAEQGQKVIEGQDWGGADLIPADGDVLSGTFTNINRFIVGEGVTVYLGAGDLSVQATSITINGSLVGPGRNLNLISDMLYFGPSSALDVHSDGLGGMLLPVPSNWGAGGTITTR
ncbi:MAG: hypothetical protein NDI77_00385 [Geobacteraceae bacterium]|nr:hypothetical protein [Geobacteraceae bacterium]